MTKSSIPVGFIDSLPFRRNKYLPNRPEKSDRLKCIMDSAAKPLLPGFFEKMIVEIIEVFFCKAAHFSENRGFCSRIYNVALTPKFGANEPDRRNKLF